MGFLLVEALCLGIPLARRELLSVALGASSTLAPPRTALAAYSPLPALGLAPPLCSPLVATLRSPTSAKLALVGTAHISDESANLVRDVIRQTRPDTVMVELDERRASRLVRREAQGAPPPEPRPYSLAAVFRRLVRLDFDAAGSNAVGTLLAELYKKLDSLGFQSGAEFVTAIREADAIGATILLGDQDAEVTLGRLRDALREVVLSGALSRSIAKGNELYDGGDPALRDLANAAKLGSTDGELTREGVLSSLAILQQRDTVRTLTSTIRQELPPLYSALIAERDAYMARALLSRTDMRSGVAVVGLAHVDGIERNLISAGWETVRKPGC